MKVFKKILLGVLLLSTTLGFSQGFTMGNRILMGSTTIEQGEITLTSTSVLASWSPTSIVNLGSTLDWTVSGGVTIATTTIDDPTFDFSGNSGTANILIENTGDLQTININSLDLITADFSNSLNTSIIVVSQNSLTTFITGNNTTLSSITCHTNLLTALDISNNTSLISLTAQSNSFSAGVLDQIYIDLDTNGLSTGTLVLDSGRTAASDTARANLITKSWGITEI